MRGKKNFMQKENSLAVGKFCDHLPISTVIVDGMKNKKCSNLKVSRHQSRVEGFFVDDLFELAKCIRMLEGLRRFVCQM